MTEHLKGCWEKKGASYLFFFISRLNRIGSLKFLRLPRLCHQLFGPRVLANPCNPATWRSRSDSRWDECWGRLTLPRAALDFVSVVHCTYICDLVVMLSPLRQYSWLILSTFRVETTRNIISRCLWLFSIMNDCCTFHLHLWPCRHVVSVEAI